MERAVELTELRPNRGPAIGRVYHTLVRFARKKPLGAFGGIVLLGALVCALFAPQVAPYTPERRTGNTLARRTAITPERRTASMRARRTGNTRDPATAGSSRRTAAIRKMAASIKSQIKAATPRQADLPSPAVARSTRRLRTGIVPPTGASGRRVRVTSPRITLLSRPGCHLCDDAREVVRRVADDLGVAWDERDITLSEQDMCEYWDKIPVTFVDGVQHDFWRVSEDRLRAALTA